MTDIKIGFVDHTVLVYIPDPASTDGSGKTGLVAANLTVSYSRVETDNDVTVTDVTSSLNNLAALTSTHNDWGLLEVSNTLAPGLYRLDIADAVFASGAWYAVVYVMITTSAAAASPIKFDLIAYDRLDTVRLGLTALPNAAADAAGGLPISDAGGLDMDAVSAKVWDVDATGHQTQGTFGQAIGDPVADTHTIYAATVTDASGVTVGADTTSLLTNVAAAPAAVWDLAVAGHTTSDTFGKLWDNVNAALNYLDDFTTGAAGVSIASVNFAQGFLDLAQAVWDADATAHQDQGSFGQAIGDPVADTGTIYKAVVTDATGVTVGTDTATLLTRMGTPTDLGGGATLAFNLSDIEAQTDDIGVAGAGLTNINLPDQTMNITGDITGNLSGTVGSVTGAVGSVTGAVGSVTGNVGGNVVGTVGSVVGAVGSVTGNVGGNVVGTVASVVGAVGSVTGNVGGNVTGNVTGTLGGLTAAALKDFFDTDSTTTYAGAVAGSVVKEIADNAGGSALTVQGIVDGVWDEAAAGHVGAGSFGKSVADVKTKTDSLTYTVANVVDANIHRVNDVVVTGTGVVGDEWGP